jgi:hypothetical protein
MDDPTRWCENDTGNGTRLPGLPIPSGSPFFFNNGPPSGYFVVLEFSSLLAASITPDRCPLSHALLISDSGSLSILRKIKNEAFA